MTEQFPYLPLPIDPRTRQLWSDGPWQQEVDTLTWQDARTHLPCAMIRHNSFGSWNGYVGVPPDHPLHGLPVTHQVKPSGDLDQIGELGRDFGAIDFFHFLCTAKDTDTVPLTLLLPAHGGLTYAALDDQYWWWFGFDCSHAGDLLPINPYVGLQTYRDQDYVYGIVTRLAWAIEAAKTLVEPVLQNRKV